MTAASLILYAMGTVAARTRAADRAYADALLHLCALSIVAGGIHAVVAARHFDEYWAFGAFFAALAIVQLGWGPWVYSRPSALGMRAGIAINAAVIVVWIASRTVGVPLGPEPWRPEAVGPLDLAASAAEALVVVLACAFLATVGEPRGAAALPGRLRPLQPVALAVMAAGLLILLLGGARAH
jgi:hypothetical protein